MTMTREQARRHINGRPLTDFVALERSPRAGANMYACPVCGSGTGRNKTGALKIDPHSFRVMCFSGKLCFTDRGEDTLGALRTIWKCSEAEAFEKAGYTLDDTPQPEQKKYNEYKKHFEQKESKPQADYTNFYREAHEALLKSPEALKYLHGRGITDESIKRFNLGYCAAWKHSTTLENEKKYKKTFPGTKRIIIPRTKGTYTARRIDKPANEFEADYTKQVQGRQKDLFNLEALEAGETPWIVEGELDAISLLQAGAEAVIGIGTISNIGRILEEAKKHPEKVYNIALDNDEPGKAAQEKLAQEMQAAGLAGNALKAAFYGDAKDGNEAFVKDPEALGRKIALIEAGAKQLKKDRDEKRRAELEKRTGAGMLQSFLKEVKTRQFEPIPTGIIDIDRATEGGFTRRTLVLISGAPGLGKTALAQLIAENMAKAGRDCLFLNLEMDRNQLIARSISRNAWTEEKADISPLKALRGYEWTEEQAEQIDRALARFEAETAERLIYNPDELTNEMDNILQVMEAETARIKAAGRAEPIIILDYINLVDTGERDATEGLKKVIYTLKDFAKKHNTVVVGITATNRASNKAGTVEMESGRDTSAVEYSGDLMLGLSFAAIEEGRKYDTGETDKKGNPIQAEYTLDDLRRLRREAYDRDETPPSVCNEISLRVLKNRFGEPERRARLYFDGRHNNYTMLYQEAKEYTGDDWETITK